MSRFTLEGSRSRGGFQWSTIAHLVYRFFQIIMACVVIGYYASDLNAARKVHKYSDSKWVFAVVVGSMSAITALFLGIISIFVQYQTIIIFIACEWILVILWAAVSGLFGNMYFGEKAEMDHGVESMKTAASFDIVNLILWFISAVTATALFFLSGRKTLHTGRANR